MASAKVCDPGAGYCSNATAIQRFAYYEAATVVEIGIFFPLFPQVWWLTPLPISTPPTIGEVACAEGNCIRITMNVVSFIGLQCETKQRDASRSAGAQILKGACSAGPKAHQIPILVSLHLDNCMQRHVLILHRNLPNASQTQVFRCFYHLYHSLQVGGPNELPW